MTGAASPVPKAPRWLVGVVVLGLFVILGTLAWFRKRSEWDFSVHPVENPTAWEYPAPAAELVEAVCAGPFFDGVARPLRRDDEAMALVVHQDPRVVVPDEMGADDVLLWTDHRPIARSPVFRKAGKPLPFLADFLLRVTPLDAARTRVAVEAVYAEIVTGQTLGFLNPHGGSNVYEPAPPTTVEEYRVLQEIARRLGGPELPPVVLPAVEGAGEDARRP